MTDNPIPARTAPPEIVEAVMTHYALTNADDIRLLTDAQLLRTPGIGRIRMNRLRQDFPAAEALEQPERHDIKLGSIRGVLGVQLADKGLVISTWRSPRFRVMEIDWDADLPEGERRIRGSFGQRVDPEAITDIDGFPRFDYVTSVEVVHGSVYSHLRVLKVRIESRAGIFIIDLVMSNDGECPLGPEIEPTDFGLICFLRELETIPEVRKALQRCERGIESAGQALSSGRASAAMQAYCKIQKDVALVLATAAHLAELRGVQIWPEKFGLAQSDRSGPPPSGDFVGAKSLFMGRVDSLLSVAGDLLRHHLDRGAHNAVRAAVQKILKASTWMDTAQRAQVSQCLTILDEISALRCEIAQAGLAGVSRKSIVASIDERHGWDGGMTRRAILRWLDGQRSEFLRIKAPKGVLYRTNPDRAAV